MARGLSSSVKTELATGVIDPVLLVEIEFGTPVYLTNASFDITSSVSGSSRTYLSNGHFKNITGVNETNKPTKNSLQLSLSGVDQTYISIALSENIIVYKTALNQYRPYLSLKDAFKVFKFCIEKNFFHNDIFNVLSGNFTVNQILSKIRKYKKNINIKLVNSPIMNQLSYHVSQKKINRYGLILNSDIEKDIRDTIKLLRNI